MFFRVVVVFDLACVSVLVRFFVVVCCVVIVVFAFLLCVCAPLQINLRVGSGNSSQ